MHFQFSRTFYLENGRSRSAKRTSIWPSEELTHSVYRVPLTVNDSMSVRSFSAFTIFDIITVIGHKRRQYFCI